MTKAEALLEYVERYIEEEEISCEEVIWQCDNISLGSLEFIKGCCEIVGYYKENKKKGE